MSRYFVFILTLRVLLPSSFAELGPVKVYLENGDSISGALVDETEDAFTLSVEYLGEVTVSKAYVSKIQRPEVELVDVGIPKDETMTSAEADVKSEIVSVEASGEDERGVMALVAGMFDPLPDWDKRLQVGLNSNSGRKEQTNFNYRFDLARDLERSEVSFNAEYSYGMAEDVKNVDRLSSELHWRKDLGPGMFYESVTGYSWDAIKLIDSNYEQKLGLGTRVFDTDASTLSAGLGASGRLRDLADNFNEEDPQKVAYLVDVFQDWNYRMSDRIYLKQDFKFAVPLEESDEYEMKFSAALTSDVTESINLSVRYEVGYDNSLAEELRQDRRFVSALGYAF